MQINRKFLLFVFLSAYMSGILAQKKMPLDHSVYDNWKSINIYSISNDGSWVSYTVDPQEGDGQLFLYNIDKRNYDSVERGFNAKFSSNSNMLLFSVKPHSDTVRAAKLKK